jgi:hypothetical protein
MQLLRRLQIFAVLLDLLVSNMTYKKVITFLKKEKKRWIKHSYRSRKQVDGKSTVCFCLVGAINEIYGNNSYESNEAQDKVRKVLRAYSLDGTPASIEGWNDKQSTTLKDVLRVATLANI